MQCNTPSSFGSRTSKALSEGKLPPKVAIWPGDVLHPALVHDAKCVPLSNSVFERKLILDMPELSIAEAKVVADCMVRAADFAVNMQRNSSLRSDLTSTSRVSSQSRMVPSGSVASSSIDSDSHTLVAAPVTPDLPGVAQYQVPMAIDLTPDMNTVSQGTGQKRSRECAGHCSGSGIDMVSHRVLRLMNSETAVDSYTNPVTDPGVPSTAISPESPSNRLQDVLPIPSPAVFPRRVRRMNSCGALEFEFGKQ